MSVALYQSKCENCDSPVYSRIENPYDLVASCRCTCRNLTDRVITGTPMKKCDQPYVTSWIVKIDGELI